MMMRPTAVEPVKATLSISMWEARAAPVVRMDGYDYLRI